MRAYPDRERILSRKEHGSGFLPLACNIRYGTLRCGHVHPVTPALPSPMDAPGLLLGWLFSGASCGYTVRLYR
ncbi:uncharacterized protein PHACADRAFT_253230 [Phanerochaete carnosa HHB-10118-sp]|uniref:Uncharacterized protein n=1 Tax=Phanerochaete carnosa (strain HHB-10118-sp) TaxID=650164 RepID=K5V7I6_PHACS|nr:uncharacterized protein PHACADRAFT_253230 [Phanerochaete carnosa HHB-10118-sp]EKM58736.1 hypothetical protein PHACADRAFT_253230 [Phanerochaete carnosa HHB-10118-sp]